MTTRPPLRVVIAGGGTGWSLVSRPGGRPGAPATRAGCGDHVCRHGRWHRSARRPARRVRVGHHPQRRTEREVMDGATARSGPVAAQRPGCLAGPLASRSRGGDRGRGYSSGPLVLAAAVRGRRSMVLEQNAMPGLTNRLLAVRHARRRSHVRVDAAVFSRQGRDHGQSRARRVLRGRAGVAGRDGQARSRCDARADFRRFAGRTRHQPRDGGGGAAACRGRSSAGDHAPDRGARRPAGEGWLHGQRPRGQGRSLPVRHGA